MDLFFSDFIQGFLQTGLGQASSCRMLSELLQVESCRRIHLPYVDVVAGWILRNVFSKQANQALGSVIFVMSMCGGFENFLLCNFFSISCTLPQTMLLYVVAVFEL